MAEKRRCQWAADSDPDMVRYHDEEWGRPAHGDRHLFEMLTLEGAQAGLSWSTILHKREPRAGVLPVAQGWRRRPGGLRRRRDALQRPVGLRYGIESQRSELFVLWSAR